MRRSVVSKVGLALDAVLIVVGLVVSVAWLAWVVREIVRRLG